MKSNKYVYPRKPFIDLSQKDLADNMQEKKSISLSTVSEKFITLSAPQVNQDASIAENIFSLFVNDAVRFGPVEYIEGQKEEWLKKFQYFIDKEEPLACTILGFPFKMAVPLKTHRKAPDMGEVLSLSRLQQLTERIGEVYAPGAKLTIFTEGGFGPFVGVPMKDWKYYHNKLDEFIKNFQFSNLSVKMLSDMEAHPDFQQHFSDRVQKCKALFDQQDETFFTKYNATYPSVFGLIDTTMYSDEMMMDVYNDDIDDTQATQKIVNARQEMKQRTHEAICSYFSYLGARDDINYLESVVPHYLALSVSPKPGRLGVIPVAPHMEVLPYHGVPVYDTMSGSWDIQYLIDIQRDSTHQYTPVHIEGDPDEAPFYFEKVSS